MSDPEHPPRQRGEPAASRRDRQRRSRRNGTGGTWPGDSGPADRLDPPRPDDRSAPDNPPRLDEPPESDDLTGRSGPADPVDSPDEGDGPGRSDRAGQAHDTGRDARGIGRDVGNFIRDLRRSAGVSLRQLADKAGVSNPYLSQVERGLRRPSAEVLAQIAGALKVSTPVMYLRAGLLDAREREGVLAAVAADPDLTVAQKQSLSQIYETFRRENSRNRPDSDQGES